MKVLIVFTVAVFAACFAEELQIKSFCGGNIFVKNEGANEPAPFFLSNGETRTITINKGSSGRVWAHVGCDGNGNNCDTVEGYVSLAEMRWDPDGMCWYDVSQVDGYNIAVTMEPFTNSGGNCRSATCHYNIDTDCPEDNKEWKDGRAIACKNPDRDRPTPYSDSIKRVCPGVYSWSQDDNDGMRACQPGNPGLRVTFC